MDRWFHPTLYDGCNHVCMIGLKFNHFCKRGPWYIQMFLYQRIPAYCLLVWLPRRSLQLICLNTVICTQIFPENILKSLQNVSETALVHCTYGLRVIAGDRTNLIKYHNKKAPFAAKWQICLFVCIFETLWSKVRTVFWWHFGDRSDMIHRKQLVKIRGILDHYLDVGILFMIWGDVCLLTTLRKNIWADFDEIL